MPVRDGAPPDCSAEAASPPATDPSSLRLGAVTPGSDGSQWMVSPGRPLGLPDLVGEKGKAASDPAEAKDKPRWVLFRDQHDWEDAWTTHDNGGRPFHVRATSRLFAV